MHPALEIHLQKLHEDIKFYQTSRKVYLAPHERAERIKHLMEVIQEIRRLDSNDENMDPR